MMELRLLGLQALRGPDGREIGSLTAQPKRFALLAYLAVAGPGGYLRRDTLASVFWPELDQFAARRAVRNTLYHLREALGDQVIVTRGDDALAIDHRILSCDVVQLRAAVEAGRFEEAVDRYTGELLAGIHFANSGIEFEEWLSRERRHLADSVLRAARQLVEQKEAEEDWPAAAYWAQRACALAPDDEPWLRRTMALVARSGDTGAGLRLYEAYAHRLAAEFSLEPNPATTELAARLRSTPAAPPPLAPTPLRPATAPPQPAAVAVAAAPTGRRRRWIGLSLGVLGVSAALAAVAMRAAGAKRADAMPGRHRVLVTVFDNQTGNPQLQSLGRMTEDWIAQGILHAHLADVVDPRAVFLQGRGRAEGSTGAAVLARRTGAGLVVSGSYYASGDTLIFEASLLDARAGRIVRVVGPILSSVQTPVAALNELRSRVMSGLASVVDVHATQSLGGADEIPLFSAYQAYVEGWDSYWHGDGPGAARLFLRAAHGDTTFTSAALAAAVAAANSNECTLVDSLAEALGARPQALDRTERLTLRIADARCRGRNEEMLRLTLERADLEPGNSSSQMSAAAAALWADRPQRALELLGRVDPAVDLAWSTDTTHSAYWGGVAEALHLLGRHREELAVTGRIPPGAALTRVWLRGSALAALARPTAALALLDSAMALPVETSSDLGLAPYTDGRPEYTFTAGWVANWIARELAAHGDTVAARQAAERAIAWYRGRSPAERATPEERLVASWSLEIAGRYAEAARIARQLVAEDSANVDYRGELTGLMAESGNGAAADSLDRWLSGQAASRVGWSASLYRARAAALLGRDDSAVARTREAIEEGAWPRWLDQEPALAALKDRADFAALTAPRD